jgi:diacylglycerol kinase (ATP)
MKLKMIYNPMAGRGRARKHVGKALAYLREHGANVDCVPSASPADLTRIAAENSRGEWDRVVVCGGDGSLHLAVRDFDLQRGALALLPLGSGHDFARVVGIPRTIIGACDAILYGKTREVGVATANGLRCFRSLMAQSLSRYIGSMSPRMKTTRSLARSRLLLRVRREYAGHCGPQE